MRVKFITSITLLRLIATYISLNLILFIGFNNYVKASGLALDTNRIVAFNNNLSQVKSFDSTLVNFHNQLPYYQNKFSAGLGSIVLPQNNLLFSPQNSFGFSLMNNVYDLFEYSALNHLNFNAAKPITDMGFGVGAKKESYFSFLHTQNFGKHFNFGSSLRTSRTESFYANQNPHYVNFSVFASYCSPSRKYFITTNAIVNRLFHQENGGVDTSTLFIKKGVRQNPEIVATNMKGATFKKNTNSFSAKQFINFNAAKKDTVEKDFLVEDFGTQHLYHTFDFSENWMRYTDTSFENFSDQPKPIDKTGIKDFLYHQKVENSIGYEQGINPNNSRFFGFDVGVKHSYNYISQPTTKLNFNSIWLHANSDFLLFDDLKIIANYSQAIGGYNARDKKLTAKIFLSKNIFNSTTDIGLIYNNCFSAVNYIQQQYTNSHFNWNNAFNKVATNTIGVFFTSDVTTLQLNYLQTKNIVYYDSTFTPKQYLGSQKLLQFVLNHPIKINKLNIATSLLYQKNLSDTDVVRLPQYIISEQIYFEGFLFKKALLSQAGIEFNYTSSYYGNGYVPLLNQFYVQDKFLVGGYPQLDVFFNFKIKQVRIFVKACNVNYGFYPNNFVGYQVANYPMPPRMFRLGIIWRFWN